MITRSDYLFNQTDMHTETNQRERTLIAEVEDLTADYALKVSVDDLCNHLEDKYRFDVPVLNLTEIHISDSGETNIDISQDLNRHIPDRSKPSYIKGTFATFAVPFEGDSRVFRYNPNLIGGHTPRGNIEGDTLELRFETTEHNPTAIRAAFDREVQVIQQRLSMISDLADQFNRKLNQIIKERITKRREKILKDQGMTSALGFPIKRRNDAPHTYSVPITRKRLSVQLPTATKEAYKAEPTLNTQEYEHILNVISNMVTVMEQSPRAFIGMGEEDLRQHFLVQLNGQYEGQATGETFNFDGKTDILIRSEGRNVFIAECKFWKGQENFRKTIDQLLNYTCWRDTKTAIIIFNRNKDLSNVLSKIPDTIESHTNFKKRIEYKSETGFRYVLHQRDDENREVILTVLVFEVPK